jgi:O-antigen biosynthesis protein
LARYDFASGFAPGRRVLDIACGTGYGARMLRDAGAESVCGVDISSDAIAYAHERFAVPGVRFAQGDICTYGEDDSVELISCFETIEHLPDPAAALRNLRRVLVRGGALVISSPNRPVHAPTTRSATDPPPNPFHVCEFTPSELRAVLADSGFAAEVRTWGQRFSPRMPRLGHRLYNRLGGPAGRTSARVQPQRPWTSPRYFVLVAH